MELLLKKSQMSLLQIQATMSDYFDVERKVRGGYEWMGGDLKQIPGLGRQDPEDEAWVFATVPYADKEKRTMMTRILSPFSGALYRIRLHNVDLPTTLAIITRLQGMGADVGFVAPTTGDFGGRSRSSPGEEFVWPGNYEAELSKASELHKLYEENVLGEPKHGAEPPPHQLCAGNPSGELCVRCSYNTLGGGESFCLKYKMRTAR